MRRCTFKSFKYKYDYDDSLGGFRGTCRWRLHSDRHQYRCLARATRPRQDSRPPPIDPRKAGQCDADQIGRRDVSQSVSTVRGGRKRTATPAVDDGQIDR